MTETRIRIVQDTDPSSPRDEDCNFGTMVCWHTKYTLGDKRPDVDHEEYLRQLAFEACPRLEKIVDHWNQRTCYIGFDERHEVDEINTHIQSMIDHVLNVNYTVMPLHLMDHSGLSINTDGFSCMWDSGQVGIIHVSLKECRENWMKHDAVWTTPLRDCKGKTLTMREYAERIMKSEVNTYDQYLRGDVYGFIMEELHPPCELCKCGGDWEGKDSCWGFYGSDPFKNGMAGNINKEFHNLLKESSPC